jgi:hypothetical protein
LLALHDNNDVVYVFKLLLNLAQLGEQGGGVFFEGFFFLLFGTCLLKVFLALSKLRLKDQLATALVRSTVLLSYGLHKLCMQVLRNTSKEVFVESTSTIALCDRLLAV